MDKRSPRVLYVTPGGIKARGGMGSVARCLIANFRALQSPPIVTVVDSYGPGRFILMPFYFLSAMAQMAWAGLLRRADVVHIHMSHRGSVWRKIALLRLAGFFGLPVLLHVHGSLFEVFCEGLSAARRQWLARQMARAGLIVVLGTHWRHYLVEQLHIEASKIVIIPNGVDLPDEAPRVASAVCRIVALGILSERKGTPELLRALASPAMKDLSWKAVIAGNGDVAFYRAEAERLGIAARVEMPGWQHPGRARAALAEADIFVLPSHQEGLPVAILEAMAAGVAVVTTPVGAIPDLVIDRETGVLVPPGQDKLLANALLSLVQDAEKRQLYGSNGRKRVAAEFNSKIFTDKVAQLYVKLGHRQSPER